MADFVYETEPLNNGSIRVLMIEPEVDDSTIQCSIWQTDTLENYTCLSYTWGPDQDTRYILLNGQVFAVRPSLWEFLNTARRYGIRQLLWIDAICINQSDVPEKNVQVAMMGKIYRLADQVIVSLPMSDELAGSLHNLDARLQDILATLQIDDWVIYCDEIDRPGDEWSTMTSGYREQFLDNLYSGTAIWKIACTKYYTQLDWSNLDYATRWKVVIQSKLENVDQPMSQNWNSFRTLAGGLFNFVSSGYWERAWILQEIVLARDVRLMSPIGTLPIDLILCFAQYWISQELVAVARDEDSSAGALFDRLAELMVNLDPFILRLSPKQPKLCPIPKELDSHFPGQLEALQVTKRLKCQNPRDRVYAVLSLLPEAENFKIDYGCELDQLLWQILNFEAHVSAGAYQDMLDTKAVVIGEDFRPQISTNEYLEVGRTKTAVHKLIDANILGHAIDLLGMTKPTNCTIVSLTEIPVTLLRLSKPEAMSWVSLDYGRNAYRVQDAIYGKFNVAGIQLLIIWPLVFDSNASAWRVNGYLASVWNLNTFGHCHIKSRDDSFRSEREQVSEVDCPCCVCNLVQPHNGFVYWPWYPCLGAK